MRNKQLVKNKLIEYNEIMNVGLGFFGIITNINDENQIEFYDEKNNLLFIKENEILGEVINFDNFFNENLKSEFEDLQGNKITYSIDKDKHIFLLFSPKEEKYLYRVEIIKKSKQEKYSKIKAKIMDANADYVVKKIEIDDENLVAELNNQSGPYGNYKNGIKRYLRYRNSKMACQNLLFMIEDEWYEKGHQLVANFSKIRIDNRVVIEKQTRKQFSETSRLIVCHPRNQELILYVIEELNKYLPGIKEFVINNFSLYNFIVNSSYEMDPIIEFILQDVINENCNLNKKEKVKTKNIYDVYTN